MKESQIIESFLAKPIEKVENPQLHINSFFYPSFVKGIENENVLEVNFLALKDKLAELSLADRFNLYIHIISTLLDKGYSINYQLFANPANTALLNKLFKNYTPTSFILHTPNKHVLAYTRAVEKSKIPQIIFDRALECHQNWFDSYSFATPSVAKNVKREVLAKTCFEDMQLLDVQNILTLRAQCKGLVDDNLLKELLLQSNKDIAIFYNNHVSIEKFLIDNDALINREKTSDKFKVYDLADKYGEVEHLVLTPNNTYFIHKVQEKGNLYNLITSGRFEYSKIVPKTEAFCNVMNNYIMKQEKPSISMRDHKIIQIGKDSVKVPLQMSQFRIENLDVNNNHFVSHRRIDPKTLSNPIFSNICFGNYTDSSDNKMAFLFRNSYGASDVKSILFYGDDNSKKFAKNSDKENSLWFSQLPFDMNGNIVMPKNVFVMESPLNCISHYQIYKPKNPLYVATGGSISDNQCKLVADFVRRYRYANNNLCFDNDRMGAIYTAKVLSEVFNKFTYLNYHSKNDFEIHMAQSKIGEGYKMVSADKSGFVAKLFLHNHNQKNFEQACELMNDKFDNGAKIVIIPHDGYVTVMCGENVMAIRFINDYANNIIMGGAFSFQVSKFSDFNDDLVNNVRLNFDKLGLSDIKRGYRF